MCNGDFEYFAVDRTVRRRARKPHRCDACGETIPECSYYFTHTGLGDGAWYTTKQCARCRAMYEAICARKKGHREPVSLTLDCGTSWVEAFGESPPDDVAALAFALPGDP